MPANLPGVIDAEAHNLVNVTVDDSYPDPFTNNSILYTGDWSAGQNCPYCFAQPDDKNKVYNASWHDTTYDNKDRRPSGTAAFNFTGSAVYVYGILSADGTRNHGRQFTSDTYLEFFIDGTQHGNYSYSSHGNDSWSYNIAVFASDPLPHELHKLHIQNGREGGSSSLLLLDYLVYTKNGDNLMSSMSNIPATSTLATSATSTINTSPAETPAEGSGASVNRTLFGSTVIFGSLFGLLCVVGCIWLPLRRWRARVAQERYPPVASMPDIHSITCVDEAEEFSWRKGTAIRSRGIRAALDSRVRGEAMSAPGKVHLSHGKATVSGPRSIHPTLDSHVGGGVAQAASKPSDGRGGLESLYTLPEFQLVT